MYFLVMNDSPVAPVVGQGMGSDISGESSSDLDNLSDLISGSSSSSGQISDTPCHKKRMKVPESEKWIKNIAKQNRNKGKAYMSEYTCIKVLAQQHPGLGECHAFFIFNIPV